MDIATIAGIFTGVTLIVLAIVSGSPLTTFIHVPSMLITVGGTVAATFINFPLKTVFGVVAIIKKTVLNKMSTPSALIGTVVKYAEKARKEGMLALEDESETEPDEFLRLGLRLAVDGTDPQLLQKILENDINALERRHQVGIGVVQAMGTFAPAFGMIGTLVGLVQMLSNMSSPDGIGAGMAVALLTTFYGAFMANVFFLPLAGKLKNRSAEELLLRDLILEGINSIQTGDSPRVVEEKLKSFLAPKDRAALKKEQGMSRKKNGGSSGPDEPSAPFWMLTYGDVMTLLLTFFVLLLSFSSIQEAKFKQAMNALQEALGVMMSEESVLDNPLPPEGEGDQTEMQTVETQMTELIEIVQDAGLGEDVDVIPTDQGYALRISSPVLFDLASAELKPTGQEVLKDVGEYLAGQKYPIRVEGHTDDIPINTPKFPSNWELSTARSLSVLRLLNSNGVAATRLSAAGYGEFKPILSNDTPENRQVNRRVEIFVNVMSADDREKLDGIIRR